MRASRAECYAARSLAGAEGATRTSSARERRERGLSEAARQWLDAAARLRRRGERVTAPALLVALLERSTADAERAAERAVVANAEGDRKARELGVEPGSAADALREALKNRR